METRLKQNPILEGVNLKNKVENNYGLTNLNYYLVNNNRNTIYLLENESSKYIFKVYEHNFKHLEELKAEVELVDVLNQQGASVAYPIRDQEGNFIQDFLLNEEILYGVLYSFAEGEAYYSMNDGQLASAARELAKMHNISKDIKLNYDIKESTLHSLVMESLKSIKPAFTKMEQEYDELFGISKKILKKLESFDCPALPSGYCHFDFSPSNFHFKDDNSIIIFDFDNMTKGILIMDIGSLFLYYFFSVRMDEITNEEANHAFTIFMDNYTAVRKLSDLEIQVLPYFFFGVLMNAMKFKVEYQIDLDYLEDYVTSIRLFIDREGLG